VKTLGELLARGEEAMAAEPPGGVTTALQELHAGKPDAQERLLHLVYDELRRTAAGFLRGERPGHTWESNDLVQEALARLLGAEVLGRATTRLHFFGVVRRTMRELLVEHARLRNAQKREGCRRRQPLDDVEHYFRLQNLDPLGVHEAVERLAGFAERPSQVVTLRYFFGFTAQEVAQQLEVSVSTVESDLRFAKPRWRSCRPSRSPRWGRRCTAAGRTRRRW
jgi:RNA polymerase sigma factor (TIGR02999 family)